MQTATHIVDLGNVSVPRSIFLALVRYFTVDDFAQKLQANISSTPKGPAVTRRPITLDPLDNFHTIRFNDSVVPDQLVTFPVEPENWEGELPQNGKKLHLQNGKKLIHAKNSYNNSIPH